VRLALLPPRRRARKMDGLEVQEWVWTTAALVAVLAAASWADVKYRRIPNWVTLAGVLLGLFLHAWGGIEPLGHGLLGVAGAFLIALPAFATGVLGGGDAKLLLVVGAFLGPVQLLPALLVIAAVGGILAVLEAMRQRVLVPVLLSCGHRLLQWVTLGRAGEPVQPAGRRLTVPYGVAIAVGTLVWWLFGGSA
jgi:prepilin peptidase CpaA